MGNAAGCRGYVCCMGHRAVLARKGTWWACSRAMLARGEARRTDAASCRGYVCCIGRRAVLARKHVVGL
jgi:hypothetical protein